MTSNSTPSSLDINPNVWTDPMEMVRKSQSEAVRAELKAKTSFVALAIITFTGITLTAIYMPALVPAALIIAGSATKCVYNKFYLSYKDESLKHTEFAKHFLGIANKINEYANKNLTGFDFVHKLREFGIISRKIQHKDTLEAMDPNKDTYRSLRNLIGRVEYWSHTAKQIEKDIHGLNKEIQKKHKLMHSPGVSSKEQQELKSSWLLLNMQKHKLEEEKLLPCKLAAAFNLHVIDNIKDTKPAGCFGTPEPCSYLDAVTWKDASAQPYYFFAQDANRKPLSKKWLMDHPIQTIAKEVFGAPSLILA